MQRSLQVGEIVIKGSGGSRNPFSSGVVLLLDPGHTPSLNGADGNPVVVMGSVLQGSNAVVGSLTVAHGSVLGPVPSTRPGRLMVSGGVTLDSSSEILEYFTSPGSKAGTAYWQLRASGNVNLGHAHLIPSVANKRAFGPNQRCPKLRRGAVDTLIRTTGSIVGRFANIRNGGTIRLTCASRHRPRLRIHYRTHRVTAVVR